MRSEASTTSSDTASLLNEHVRAVKLLQARLERLAGLRQRGRMSESLYDGIMDEVRLRIELFGTERDALMDLLDEYVALLERTDVEPFFTGTLVGPFEVFEEYEGGSPVGRKTSITERYEGRSVYGKICVACGVSNPAEANFCVSCAAKLPSLVEAKRIWG